MTVLSFVTDTVGQVGINPRIIKITSSDVYATVIAANYLQNRISEIKASDLIEMNYSDGTATGVITGFFTPTISGGNITLSPLSSSLPNVLRSSLVSPDTAADLVTFDVAVGQAALAAGGSVTLIDSSGTKRYKIRSLQLNSGGTNFSGGGGDRLGQVTDATTVYSVIPAATMQTLANAQWGATALPNPASTAINTSTAAGADLVFKYSGGTTDYTAGSLVISGVAERVA